MEICGSSTLPAWGERQTRIHVQRHRRGSKRGRGLGGREVGGEVKRAVRRARFRGLLICSSGGLAPVGPLPPPPGWTRVEHLHCYAVHYFVGAGPNIDTTSKSNGSVACCLSCPSRLCLGLCVGRKTWKLGETTDSPRHEVTFRLDHAPWASSAEGSVFRLPAIGFLAGHQLWQVQRERSRHFLPLPHLSHPVASRSLPFLDFFVKPGPLPTELPSQSPLWRFFYFIYFILFTLFVCPPHYNASECSME